MRSPHTRNNSRPVGCASPGPFLGFVAAAAAFAVALLGCAPPADEVPQLRVVNVGTQDIENLTIVFPSHTVEFGDVPSRSTTSYAASPGGVYGYSAFRFDLGGENRLQPVIDWVGAEPRQGTRFTYWLELMPGSPPGIRIADVTTDLGP